MDVWRITLAALRRWYVLLPLLALTGVGVILSGGQSAPEYEASAAALLTPGRVEAAVANPYGNVDGANQAVGIVLNSVESRRTVQEQGLSGAYEVGAQPRSPILTIEVRAASAEVAQQTAQAVLDLAVEELQTRQTEGGVPPNAQIMLGVLEPPAVLAAVTNGSLRVQAVVLVLGGGLSVLVAVLFDDIVGLWRRGRDKRRSPGHRQSGAAAAASTSADEPTAIEAGATSGTESAPDEAVTLEIAAVRAGVASRRRGELPRRRPNRARPEPTRKARPDDEPRVESGSGSGSGDADGPDERDRSGERDSSSDAEESMPTSSGAARG